MEGLITVFFDWGVLALQLIGICSVLLARTPCLWSRRAFVGCLTLVGLATLIGLCHGNTCWVACGTTFTAMLVGAVMDCGAVSVQTF